MHNFALFQERLSRIGLDQLEILKPMAYLDLAFLEWALWASPEMEAFEKSIHDVMFPEAPFPLRECQDGASEPVDAKRKWINRKCDVQALWSHINADRDVFVTSDSTFHQVTKKPRLISLGAKQILSPQDAAAMA